MALSMALKHCAEAAGNTHTGGVFSVSPGRSAGKQQQGRYFFIDHWAATAKDGRGQINGLWPDNRL